MLGALTLFASALITGGVGPWLPFQMFGAAWVGFFAGCLPPARGRRELVLLAAYGFVAGLAYGLLLDLWFWPYLSAGTTGAPVPGAALAENLHRFLAFHLATAMGWDLVRAMTNAVLVLVVGAPVLAALRRVARRAAFGAPVAFHPEPHPEPVSETDLPSAGLTGSAPVRLRCWEPGGRRRRPRWCWWRRGPWTGVDAERAAHRPRREAPRPLVAGAGDRDELHLAPVGTGRHRAGHDPDVVDDGGAQLSIARHFATTSVTGGPSIWATPLPSPPA